jgi:hypothetical protein
MKATLAALLTASVLLLSAAAAQDGTDGGRDIIFGKKIFSDLGGIVSISGTVTGDGVRYKNNSVNVTCYKDYSECLVVEIDQIGERQVGSLDTPLYFPIIKWDAYEVIAELDVLGSCLSDTIRLDRRTKTGIWERGPGHVPCNEGESPIHIWTIEDPPFWRNFLRERGR